MILKELLSILQDWLQLLAPITIFIGFLWKVWLKKKYTKLSELYVTIEKISEEFKPNGGSTLRDSIDRIEQKLKLQDEKILGIIKSSPIGTWVSDKQGKCIDVNRMLCTILDRTESEIKGDNWLNWVHPSDANEVYVNWNRAITNQIDFDMKYRFVLPDGKIQAVHATAYQLKSDSGDVIGFLGTMLAIGHPEIEFNRANW